MATIRSFWPLDRIAAYLLVPYLAWVCYATALNAAIWRLNADGLGLVEQVGRVVEVIDDAHEGQLAVGMRHVHAVADHEHVRAM